MLSNHYLFMRYNASCEAQSELFVYLTQKDTLKDNEFRTPENPKALKEAYQRFMLDMSQTPYYNLENYPAVAQFISYFTRSLKSGLPPAFYRESFLFLSEKFLNALGPYQSHLYYPNEALTLGFGGLIKLASFNQNPKETQELLTHLRDYPQGVAAGVEENINYFIREWKYEEFQYYEKYIFPLAIFSSSNKNSMSQTVALLNSQEYLRNFLYATSLPRGDKGCPNKENWFKRLNAYAQIDNELSAFPFLNVLLRAKIEIFPLDYFEHILLSANEDFLPGLFAYSPSYISNIEAPLALYKSVLFHFDSLYEKHKLSRFEEKNGVNLLTFILLHIDAQHGVEFLQEFQLPIIEKLLDKNEIINFPTLNAAQTNKLEESASLYILSLSLSCGATDLSTKIMDLEKVYNAQGKTAEHQKALNFIYSYQEQKSLQTTAPLALHKKSHTTRKI